MRFTKLFLQNWRNFLSVDVTLRERMFVVGPNASGKSNFLDAFRFLRDLAEPRGGFQQAVQIRGGVSRLRSLHARHYPDVVVDVGADQDVLESPNRHGEYLAIGHAEQTLLAETELVSQLVAEVLVVRKLDEFAAAEQIRPAVADVGHNELGPVVERCPERDDHSGSHAVALRAFSGRGEHLAIGDTDRLHRRLAR